MKRSIIGLFVGLFTFVLGVGVSLSWIFSSSQDIEVGAVIESVAPAPIQTTVCRMVDGDKSLDNKIVEFEALTYMIVDGTIILYPKDCVSQGLDFLLPELDVSSVDVANRELTSLINGIKRNSTGDHKEVEIRITGRSKIIEKYGVRKTYSVIPIEVKLISPFRPSFPKGGG